MFHLISELRDIWNCSLWMELAKPASRYGWKCNWFIRVVLFELHPLLHFACIKTIIIAKNKGILKNRKNCISKQITPFCWTRFFFASQATYSFLHHTHILHIFHLWTRLFIEAIVHCFKQMTLMVFVLCYWDDTSEKITD